MAIIADSVFTSETTYRSLEVSASEMTWANRSAFSLIDYLRNSDCLPGKQLVYICQCMCRDKYLSINGLCGKCELFTEAKFISLMNP